MFGKCLNCPGCGPFTMDDVINISRFTDYFCHFCQPPWTMYLMLISTKPGNTHSHPGDVIVSVEILSHLFIHCIVQWDSSLYSLGLGGVWRTTLWPPHTKTDQVTKEFNLHSWGTCHNYVVYWFDSWKYNNISGKGPEYLPYFTMELLLGWRLHIPHGDNYVVVMWCWRRVRERGKGGVEGEDCPAYKSIGKISALVDLSKLKMDLGCWCTDPNTWDTFRQALLRWWSCQVRNVRAS